MTSDRPFDGLFDRSAPARRGHISWRFEAIEPNESAHRLLDHLDVVLDRLHDSACVFLGTIELDVEAGRFPDVLLSFFDDPSWDYSKRFFIPEMCQDDPRGAFVVGALVFEMTSRQLSRMLKAKEGFRWGPNLRVGGMQVPESAVAEALKGSPFDPEQALKIEPLARFSWAASQDLNQLSIWISESSQNLSRQLAELRTGQT